MAHTVGETLYSEIRATLPTGLTSADIVATATLLRSPYTTVSTSVAEISTGRYVVSFSPTAAGQWSVQAVYDGSTYDESFDVDAAGSVVAAASVSSGVAKASLRRRIARLLRDWVGLTATETSSGLSTFTDEDNLYAQNGSLVTSQVKIATGHADNVWEVRRVSSNIPGTLTFSRDLPQPVAAGDTADLVNVAGRGYPFRTYDEVMAEVLDNTGRDFHIPLTATITPDFDGDSPLITLPAGFEIVHNLEYADGYDTYGLGPARTRSAHTEGWFALGDGVIRLEGRWRWEASGFPITVYGYGPHPAAPEDDDLIALDPEWFILACAARLGQMRTGDREWSQWAAQWTQEANGRRLAMATAYEPDSRNVR